VDDEGITLFNRSEVVLKVVLELHLEEVSSDAFYTIREREHMYLGGIRKIVDLGDGDHVTEFHS